MSMLACGRRGRGCGAGRRRAGSLRLGWVADARSCGPGCAAGSAEGCRAGRRQGRRHIQGAAWSSALPHPTLWGPTHICTAGVAPQSARPLLLPCSYSLTPATLPRFEFKLVDVFKLDVRPLKKFDDYLAKLSKKSRWNCKDRIKK